MLTKKMAKVPWLRLVTAEYGVASNWKVLRNPTSPFTFVCLALKSLTFSCQEEMLDGTTNSLIILLENDTLPLKLTSLPLKNGDLGGYFPFFWVSAYFQGLAGSLRGGYVLKIYVGCPHTPS